MAGRKANNVRRRPDGTHEARSVINGRRESFYGKTQAEALQLLTDAKSKAHNGGHIPASRLTVKQWMEDWLGRMEKTRRPATARGYGFKVRCHIIPKLGGTQLSRLTSEQVERWLIDLKDSGLAGQSVHHCRAILRAALNDAVKKRKIGYNPAALADEPAFTKHEIQPLNTQEARQLLQAVKGDRLEALYVITTALGLRQGEALGLHWADVDLPNRIVRIRVTLQRVKGGFVFGEPKSERSKRTLQLTEGAARALQAHHDRQDFEKKAAGKDYQDQDLVFSSEAGTPLQGTNVTKWFQALLAQHGIRRQRFHDLRHACASLLLAQGIHPRVVMEILGHSNIALTMNTYTHVVPDLQKEAANKMDAILGQPGGVNGVSNGRVG